MRHRARCPLVAAAFLVAPACVERPDHETVHAMEAGPAMAFHQSGQVVEFLQKHPVPGATITGNAGKTTADANGNYTLPIDATQPFNFTVTADGSWKLVEAETILTADFDRGQTLLLSNADGATLMGVLPGGGPAIDATKALLSVGILKGDCASEEGATIDWSPKGSGQIRYIDSGLPSPSRKSAKGGQFPHAVLYNLDSAAPITVTVTPPAGCTVAPFPYDDPSGIRYTTNTVKVEAGSTMTFLRIFFK
jgi:hypothetical protein